MHLRKDNFTKYTYIHHAKHIRKKGCINKTPLRREVGANNLYLSGEKDRPNIG
jgi:hypothetical protein